MQAFFYTSPVEGLDVALIVTDKDPEQLKYEGVRLIVYHLPSGKITLGKRLC